MKVKANWSLVRGIVGSVRFSDPARAAGQAGGDGEEKTLRREVSVELDGRTIVIDVDMRPAGQWDYPIGVGDSLVVVTEKYSRTREGRKEEIERGFAYKNFNRGYTQRVSVSDGLKLLMSSLAVSVICFAAAQNPPHTSEQFPLHVLDPVAPWLAYGFGALCVPVVYVGLSDIFDIFRAEFLVRRSAMEMAGGAVLKADRSSPHHFTAALDGPSVTFPARCASAIREGDRIVAAGEKMAPGRIEAKVYRNLTSGVSGSAEGPLQILYSAGWKMSVSAVLFYGFIDLVREDFGLLDFMVWVSRVMVLDVSVWVGLLLLDDFYRWRLRREARRLLKRSLHAQTA